MASLNGGHDIKTLSFDVEVKKYLNYMDESIYCTTSRVTSGPGDTTAGTVTITRPVQANIPQAPCLVWLVNNSIVAGVDANLVVDFDITYHIVFSVRHPASVTGNVV